jgi:VRR-NUC domain
LNEREFTRAVIGLAQQLGWKTAHFSNTIRVVRRKSGYATIPDSQAAGFPDLVLVKDDRIIFAELKAKRGSVTEAQYEWLRTLEKAGAETHIWREHIDWPGNVSKALRASASTEPTRRQVRG